MSPNSPVSYPRDKKGDSSEDELELLERTKLPDYQEPEDRYIEREVDTVTPTTRLPPRTLRHRSTTRVVRVTFWTSLMVLILILALSVLISHIRSFLPDTSEFYLKSSVSCDLTASNGSAFQDAFTINLRGSTHLSFSAAKAIDVLWQLFVGMGGRLLMAWISYCVFMDGLTRLMEESPLPYGLYAELTFKTLSLSSTWRATKAVYSLRGWRGKAFLSWFTVSTLYVLGFPTLISATAGYLSPSDSGFSLPDGTFLTPKSPDFVSCYILHHGELIGVKNGTVAPGPPVSMYDVVEGEGQYKPDNRTSSNKSATFIFDVVFTSTCR